MKLKSLRIENFKGISSLDISPSGQGMSIYGDNAAGKTSIFDAFTWLLFDKDSNGAKDFDIKPLDESGNVRNHAAETVVLAVVEHDGVETELKKLYREKWTKKRGAAEAEFDGHETQYFVDQLEIKKNQYQARISEYCDENVFQMVTNPRKFAALKWDERRKILFEVCGNVSDEDVITSSTDLKPLEELRGRRSMSEYRTYCAQQRTTLNGQLKEIPIRISEIGQIAECDIDEKAEKEAISKLKVALATPVYALNHSTDDGKRRMESALEAAKIEADKIKARNQTYRTQMEQEALSGNHKAINETSDTLQRAQSKYRLLLDKQAELMRQQTDYLKRRETLLKEYQTIKAENWETETVCPTCGQPIPESRLEEAKAEFESNKAKKIKDNVLSGSALKEGLEQIGQELEDLSSRISTAETFITQTSEKLESLQSQMASTSIEDMPEYAALFAEADKRIVDAEAALHNAGNGSEERKKTLEAQADELRKQIEEHEIRLTKFNAAKSARERIAELEEQQGRVNSELEKMERGLWLCEQFTKAKVSMVESSINGRFRAARFKLFDTQINGAVVDCCEATFNGVPYDALNNAAKINIGLDIIRTLSAHYGFSAPVFVDNAESVTELYRLDAQMIRLVVSEPDKELRCQYD